jgi:predicted aspartyl protease
MTAVSGPAEQIRHGGEYFALGRFDAARSLYEAALAQAPERLDAVLRLAQLALLDNELSAARRYADRAVELAPDMPLPYGLLAEAAWRSGDFLRAAECYDDLNRPALAAVARRLAPGGAYRWRVQPAAGRLALIGGGVLPVVAARLGGTDVNLLVDTAAGELLVDRVLATALQIDVNGAERLAFAGGRSATVGHGIVDGLECGAFAVDRVPCQVLELSEVFAPFLDLPVHGVLGLGMLRHFRSTLDFRVRELHLVLPGESGAERPRTARRMWLAAGHYLVTAAEVGAGVRTMMLLDTGMAGADCVLARSLADSVPLTPDPHGPVAGHGGGGAVHGTAVRLPRLCVGDYCRSDVRAMVLRQFALERQLGFRVAGLLASDFFRTARVTLDFERMRMAVERSEDEKD